MKDFPSSPPGDHHRNASIRTMLRTWRDADRKLVNELDSKIILQLADLPIPSRKITGPAVVKFCADSAIHKSELGLVRVNVSEGDVDATVARVTRQAMLADIGQGEVLVEEMVTDCLIEWFVGCRNDATFGPVLVLGMGGIYAELFPNPEIRLAPLSKSEAFDLIRAHNAFAIMNGARGKPIGDLENFASTLVSISTFFYEHSDNIDELDLNPIMIRPASMIPNVVIADASMVLRA